MIRVIPQPEPATYSSPTALVARSPIVAQSLDFGSLRQLKISSQGAQLLPVGSAVFCSAKKRLTATRQAGLFAKLDELMVIRRGARFSGHPS